MMIESLAEKKEYVMIDYFRILCAVGVVALHLDPLTDVNIYAEYFVGNVLTRVCVPFFFTVTGFFLASKIHKWSEVRRYIGHIMKLYMVYSILYFPQVVWGWNNGNRSFAQNLLLYFKDFFLVGSYGHLWYFVATIIATVLLYIVVDKLRTNDKGIIIVAILIYSVGVLGNAYFKNWMKNQECNIIWVYYKLFSTTRNGIFFGFPFVTLGYIVARYKELIIKRNYLIMTTVAFVLMVTEVFIIHQYCNVNEIDMTFMVVPTTMFTFLMMAFVKCEDEKCRSLGIHLRKLSLLVFGFHLLVSFYGGMILSYCGINHSMIRFLIILVITLIVSETVLFFADKKHYRLFELLL